MQSVQQPPARQYRPQSAWVRAVGYLIFFSRWLQAPLYLGLILAQLVYVIVFVIELVHLAEMVLDGSQSIDEALIMLSVLGLIDVVMIANLLIMVIIGGYETFVSRINIEGHPDQPEWLSHVNANVLKVKLAMAIIGISSIHLLKTFIEVGDLGATPVAEIDADETTTGEIYTSEGVLWQVVIHTVFILSAIALAMIDRMAHKPSGPRPSVPITVSADHPSPPDHRSLPDHPSLPPGAVPVSTDHPSLPPGAVPVSGYILDGAFVERR